MSTFLHRPLDPDDDHAEGEGIHHNGGNAFGDPLPEQQSQGGADEDGERIDNDSEHDRPPSKNSEYVLFYYLMG